MNAHDPRGLFVRIKRDEPDVWAIELTCTCRRDRGREWFVAYRVSRLAIAQARFDLRAEAVAEAIHVAASSTDTGGCPHARQYIEARRRGLL